MSGVEEIQSKEQFASIIKANQFVVVDFYAVWCGPCKMISPKVDALSQELTNVKFVKIDVDKFQELAQEYEVSAMPTFVVLKSGNKADTVIGADLNKIKNAIKSVTSN